MVFVNHLADVTEIRIYLIVFAPQKSQVISYEFLGLYNYEFYKMMWMILAEIFEGWNKKKYRQQFS